MFRWARSTWFILSLGMASSSPAFATDDAGFEVEEGFSASDEAIFVIGNTLFTIYHELGHALIDLLNLPVIGREEDAVDGLAAVTMIPEKPDATGDALIVAVADAWRVQSELSAERRRQPSWGVHALDEQRFYAIVCLMVGSDQDGFYDYALEAGLPEERIASCTDDFEGMKTGWQRLLNPHRQDVAAAQVPTAVDITLAFDDPLPEQERVYHLIQEAGLLEDEVLRFAESIDLPSPLIIRFAVCDDANAYWAPSQREVYVCYELIDEFEAILLGAVTR